MSNLFLCFYGDGRAWDNTVLAMGYPKGFSYPRPFRYRDSWLDPALLEEIGIEGARKALAGQPAVLAMRFISEEYERLILPMRQVEITHIEYLPDSQSVYFKMADMVDFRQLDSLRSRCIELTADEQTAKGGNRLFLRSNVTLPENLKYVSKSEEVFTWVAYSNLIAKDFSVPIRDEARNSLFLHFQEPCNRDTARTSVVYRSSRRGPYYGSRLVEGHDYELVVHHRVPALIGSHTTIGQVNVTYGSSTGNIEFSRSQEEYTLNYQAHVVTLTAKKPTGTWEEIVVAPANATIIAEDSRTISTKKLGIPVRVRRSLWYRFKRVGLFVLLLWASLTFGELVKGIADGELPAGLIISQALAAGVAALMVLAIKQNA